MSLTKLYRYMDSENIAEMLSEQALHKIGSQALSGYNADEESRAEWMARNQDWMKLAAQLVEKKNTPWENASNVKYPLLTTAAIQFHARAYPALVPASNVVKARVVGQDVTGEKNLRATRVSKHMSYQVLEKMTEWEEDMDKLCLSLPIIGCAFKKTYYSPVHGRNVSELVPAKDLAISYGAKSLEEAYRKTQIIKMTRNQLVERQRAGIYLDCDLGEPTEQREQTNETSDSIQGVQESDTDTSARQYTLCEQHTYLDLDDDGYEEPYIITFDESDGKVLRIVANFNEEDITVNAKNEVARIEPFEHFTKYSFIPNPDGGFYDVGFGILLGPLNEASNTIINQLIDAGTLSNLQSGFLGRSIKIKKGDASFKPGEWKTINATGDDLRKSVLPLPVREPSGVLFQLLSTLLESGQRLANTTDMMVGENPGQNQAATTTMAVVEQGMKVFTAIYKRIHRSLKKEFSKLYKLNSIYLDEEEYFNVIDAAEDEAQSVTRADYNTQDMDIIPTADPNVATEAQRLAKAQGLVELIPLGVNRQEALVRVLKAQEQPSIEPLLQPEPQAEDPALAFEREKHADLMALENRKLDVKLEELGIKVEKEGHEAYIKERNANREDYKATTESQKKGSFEYNTNRG